MTAKPDGLVEEMTETQVENWRNVLMQMFGPYALIMSKEQIQAMRDKMQACLDTALKKEPRRD